MASLAIQLVKSFHSWLTLYTEIIRLWNTTFPLSHLTAFSLYMYNYHSRNLGGCLVQQLIHIVIWYWNRGYMYFVEDTKCLGKVLSADKWGGASTGCGISVRFTKCRYPRKTKLWWNIFCDPSGYGSTSGKQSTVGYIYPKESNMLLIHMEQSFILLEAVSRVRWSANWHLVNLTLKPYLYLCMFHKRSPIVNNFKVILKAAAISHR